MSLNEQPINAHNLRDVVYPTRETREAQNRKAIEDFSHPTALFADICAKNELAGDTSLAEMMMEVRIGRSNNPTLMRDSTPNQMRAATFKVLDDHCAPLAVQIMAIFNTQPLKDDTDESRHISSERINVEKFFGKGAIMMVEQHGEQYTFKIYCSENESNGKSKNPDTIVHKNFSVDAIVISNKITQRETGRKIPAANISFYTLSGIRGHGGSKFTHINPRYEANPTIDPPVQAKLDHLSALMVVHKLHQALMELTT